jgi:hypothetical protein
MDRPHYMTCLIDIEQQRLQYECLSMLVPVQLKIAYDSMTLERQPIGLGRYFNIIINI